ncbi:MAG TPA: DinB family protein [Ktedonobacteraceae bacterium]|nr:DinB family protein [Ktedonobacteraceae bacterium]
MNMQAFFLLLYDVAHTMAEELILAEQNDEQLRYAPFENQHSLAWLLWQSTRWEDLAVTMLKPGASQIFEQKAWFTSLGVKRRDVGISMSAQECHVFNRSIELPALRLYRQEVEQRTRMLVETLQDMDLEETVQQQHFLCVLETGALGTRSVPWLERFLVDRAKAWWLSSIIWRQTASLLGEGVYLRRHFGHSQHNLPEWPF